MPIDDAQPSAGRLVFANQLRGLAALSVGYIHLVGVFWALPALISGITASDAPAGPPAWLLPYIYIGDFNPGPFGVGLFFLISGLVIPLSLGQHRRTGFLMARVLRIYPVYIAALALDVAALQASAAWWHRTLPIDGWSLAANALLIHSYVGADSFDLVNWTLCIEIKFYILAALLAGPIRRGSVRALFATALGLTAVSCLVAAVSPPDDRAVIAFGTECSYLVFMLIGVLFSFRLRGLLGWPALLLSIAAMLGLFLLCWYGSAAAAIYVFSQNTLNYLYAVVLFGVLFALRRHIRPFPPLDAMAAVSYPFYLLHPLVGYPALRLFTAGLGLPFFVALALTMAVLLALSTLLHVTIERWTIRAGRRLAKRRFAVPAAVPAE